MSDSFKMEDLVKKMVEQSPRNLAKWKNREIHGAKVLSNQRYKKADGVIEEVAYVLKGGITVSFRDIKDKFIYIKGGYEKGLKSLEEINTAIQALGEKPDNETVVALNLLKVALEEYCEKLRIRREIKAEQHRNQEPKKEPKKKEKKTESGRRDFLAELEEEDKARRDAIAARNTDYASVSVRGVSDIQLESRRQKNSLGRDRAELERALHDKYYIPEDGVSPDEAVTLLKGAIELGERRSNAYDNMLQDREDQAKRAEFAKLKRTELSIQRRKITNEIEAINLESEEIIALKREGEELTDAERAKLQALNERYQGIKAYLETNIDVAIARCEEIYADAQKQIARVDTLTEDDRVAYNRFAEDNHLPQVKKEEPAKKPDEPTKKAPEAEEKHDEPAETDKKGDKAAEEPVEETGETTGEDKGKDKDKDKKPEESEEDLEEDDLGESLEEDDDKKTETPEEEEEDKDKEGAEEEEHEDEDKDKKGAEEEEHDDEDKDKEGAEEEELEEDDIGEKPESLLPYVQNGKKLYSGTRSFTDRILLRQLAYKVEHGIPEDEDLSFGESMVAVLRFRKYRRAAEDYLTEGKINYVDQFTTNEDERRDLLDELRDSKAIVARKKDKTEKAQGLYRVKKTPVVEEPTEERPTTSGRDGEDKEF